MTDSRPAIFAVLGTALLVASALAVPVAATGHDADLQIDVTQDQTYDVTVTVTDNGSAAAGANVTVIAPDGNYTAAGDYVADANGTVELPAPDQDVQVTLNVSYDGANASESLVLEGNPLSVAVEQHDDFSATVTVTDNGTAATGANVTVNATAGNYTSEGDYVTGANGTVALPAPDEAVAIDVTATYENLTATVNATLAAPGDGNDTVGTFGQLLSDFIEGLGDTDGPRGLIIADFVLANNPGNPPADAGPPDDHPLRDDGNLSIAVEEGDGNATVTVTQNGSAAAGANVTVDAVGGAAVDDEGTYTTDANGTVTFGLPARPTMTAITAEIDNASTTERVRLSVSQVGPPADAGPSGDDGNATVAGDGRGPPADGGTDAGDTGDGGGPPASAGNDGSAADGERGPPDHVDAGPPG